jgi:penicillin amidase
MLAEVSLFGHRAIEWLEKTITEANSHWFDIGHGESRDDVARLALRETVNFLKTKLGPKPEDWSWGKLHMLTYAHTLGAVKPLDRFFNRGPFPMGGDQTTIWATGSSYHDLGCANVVGPPFRFIIDLSNLSNSVSLLAPGQSGQPGSKHYDDHTKSWFTGEYHTMLFRRGDIEREAEGTLHLTPST